MHFLPAPTTLALAAFALAWAVPMAARGEAALPLLADAEEPPPDLGLDLGSRPAPEPAPQPVDLGLDLGKQSSPEQPAAEQPSSEQTAPEQPAQPAPEAPSPPPKPRPPPAPPPAEPKKEDTWLDAGHAFIEQRVFARVLRLDRFFSDERDLEAERSRSFLRWRNEIRFEEHAKPHFTTGVRASLRLPGLNKQLRRLQVVIAGQTREAFSALFPSEVSGPAPPTEQESGTADAELRYRFLESIAAHADLGAGVIMRLPPGAYGRLRFRYVLPVKKLFLTRYLATGFWRTDTHLGSSAALEAERPFGRIFLTRIGGSATVSQRSMGIEWQSEVVLAASFDPRSAAQIGAAANGATAGTPPFDRFRLYTRLRRDFYRRWIFIEIEPGVAWPWVLDRGREAVWAIALRAEVQFQAIEKPRPPPAPSPDEPKDPAPDEPKDPAPEPDDGPAPAPPRSTDAPPEAPAGAGDPLPPAPPPG